MGVTVHWMDAEFDTGPIAFQRAMALPDGTSETDATALLARVGGRLLVDAVKKVIVGEIPYQTQPSDGEYQPYPHADDFRISTDWPARRVYNFMRGTAVWGIPYKLNVDNEELLLSDAVSWSDYARLGVPFIREDDTVQIQCSPGVVRARVVK